jgi:NAD(P)-dependent dehydrogenase (short-subunit alcohol dehydrogenase family)
LKLRATVLHLANPRITVLYPFTNKPLGNTGIGKETILQLAKHSPGRIYLAARNAAKAEAAIREIKCAVSNAQVEFLELDLSSCTSIRRAASEFLRKEQRLDILINNAGILGLPAIETTEGYDIQFGTNYVGPHLLTKLLIPILLKTTQLHGLEPKGVRIINVSSAGHAACPPSGIVFDDINQGKAHSLTRYAQSKLANILETRELARLYPSITSVSVHPGVVLTQLYNAGYGSTPMIRYGLTLFGGGLFVQSVEQGALNQLWAATSGEVENGAYYNPIGSKSRGSSYAQDGELARKLWVWTEADLAKHGY